MDSTIGVPKRDLPLRVLETCQPQISDHWLQLSNQWLRMQAEEVLTRNLISAKAPIVAPPRTDVAWISQAEIQQAAFHPALWTPAHSLILSSTA